MKLFKVLITFLTIAVLLISFESCSKKKDEPKKEKPKKAEDTPIPEAAPPAEPEPAVTVTVTPSALPSVNVGDLVDPLHLDNGSPTPNTIPSTAPPPAVPAPSGNGNTGTGSTYNSM